MKNGEITQEQFDREVELLRKGMDPNVKEEDIVYNYKDPKLLITDEEI